MKFTIPSDVAVNDPDFYFVDALYNFYINKNASVDMKLKDNTILTQCYIRSIDPTRTWLLYSMDVDNTTYGLCKVANIDLIYTSLDYDQDTED
jgi:hypothetical protein